ncbi:MAG: cation:proton antiporter [Methanomassiliicoccales archaeon]
MDIEWVLFQLFVLLLLARLASMLFERVKFPAVIGEILVGVIIGNTVLYDYLRLGTDIEVFQVLAELGIIFLLFLIGLETRFSDLKKVGRSATLVALMGVIIPFIAGYLIIDLAFTSPVGALFMGAAMVATSVGITARVIRDMGLTDTMESRVIIGAAVIDDIMGMIVLAVVVGIASGGALNLIDTALVAVEAVIFVLVVIYVGTRFLPMARKRAPDDITPPWEARGKKAKPLITPLALALIVCFGLSAMASFLGLAAIIGAFLAGMAFAEFRDTLPCREGFESICELLVPFFFLYVGISVEISAFGDVLLLATIITLAAIGTKFFGCALGAYRLGKRSASIIGVGMVPRGEVGIIVASIGLSMGAISSDLFSIVVAMSIVTTMVAPPLLTHTFKMRLKKA